VNIRPATEEETSWGKIAFEEDVLLDREDLCAPGANRLLHRETRVQENQAMTAPTPAPSGLIRPFRVAISDSEIADLKQRLARTRWPDPETVPDWSQGVRVENAKSLVTYWERAYDWRRFESELNRFPQFLTTIDGLDIHFIHVKSENPDAMPLILTHGWPGSIVEFLRLIGVHSRGAVSRVSLRRAVAVARACLRWRRGWRQER